ncbi:hypothetical protein AHF37_05222 [Paragonimus kellicotti]|nr:hypothetical protein AHF37_05222 [Paragonimus kellicotti]
MVGFTVYRRNTMDCRSHVPLFELRDKYSPKASLPNGTLTFLNSDGEIQANLILDLCQSVDRGIRMMQNMSIVPNYCKVIEIYNGSLYAIVDIYMNRTVLDFFGVKYGSMLFS